MRPTALSQGASELIGQRGRVEFFEELLAEDSVRGFAGAASRIQLTVFRVRSYNARFAIIKKSLNTFE